MSAFVVGLTGGIGAGKSSVGALFAQRGALVIDADALGHEALHELRDVIAARFGADILDNEKVDRKKLGAIVFADPAARRDLEAITHPYIRRRAEQLIAESTSPLVILDAALLFEANWVESCDTIVFVDAPREQRIARVLARSGWDEATLAKREAAQLPLTNKRSRANHVISNDSSLEALGRQVDDLLHIWGCVPAAAEGTSR